MQGKYAPDTGVSSVLMNKNKKRPPAPNFLENG
jgi:hypothetical protein